MKRIYLIIMSLIFFLSTAASQDRIFEDRIIALLNNVNGYNNVERALLLIVWESTLIEEIPCISPLNVFDLRDIRVSSNYGERYHPILNEFKHHSGIDIPANLQDTVYAPANGRITKTGYDGVTGNYVKATHGFGFETLFGHLHSIIIEEGDSIKIGQPIGLIGTTGRSTGAHLHYEIKKNKKEEHPYPYCFLLIKYIINKNQGL